MKITPTTLLSEKHYGIWVPPRDTPSLPYKNFNSLALVNLIVEPRVVYPWLDMA